MSEWKRVKLKELIKEVNERNKGEKVKRVLSVTNSRGFVSQEEYFEGTVHSANISNYKIVRKNQFAYNPSRVNVGSIDILKDYEEGALSPMYIVFEVDTTKLLPDYFKYYFQTNRFFENVKNNTQGSVRNSLSFKALSDFDYLLPPIEEQEKIVEILKTIDSIIEKHESLLEEKNQFIKSQFVEMFGDIKNDNFRCVPIKKLVDTNISKVKKKYTSDDIIKYIDISSIDNVKNEIIGYTKYNIGNEPSRAQQCLIKGDILISTVRPNLKNIAVNNFNDDNVVGSSGFCVLRPKGCKVDYLLEVLKSEKFTNDMVAVTTGSNYPAIHSTDILNYEISVPPMELQNKFADIVKQIDKQKFLLEKQKQNYENLRKGLMQKLLTGKVRVKI